MYLFLTTIQLLAMKDSNFSHSQQKKKTTDVDEGFEDFLFLTKKKQQHLLTKDSKIRIYSELHTVTFKDRQWRTLKIE